MRVAIAEDNPIYRAGLIKLIEAAEVKVLHEAASGDELLALLARGDLPDAAVLDIRMAGRRDDGLVAALKISRDYPGVGILLLSASADASVAEELFASGSAGKGYMLKESLSSITDLKLALERIAGGHTYSDPQVVDELIARQRRGGVRDLLSPRERLVLTQVASGASNGAIAETLHTSVGAIEAAISSVYNKLGIPDEPSYNRRVMVVLNWLRTAGT